MGRMRTSESAKKRRRLEEGRKRNVTRICLGLHHDRWNDMRESTGSGNSEFIKHLLDVHDQFCACSNSQAMDTADHEVTLTISASGTPPLACTPGLSFSTPVCGHVDTPSPSRFDASLIVNDHDASASTLAGSLLHSPPVPDKATSVTSQTSFNTGLAELLDENEDDEEYNPNISDTRATFGEDIDNISALEEDLLNLPEFATDDDDDTPDHFPDTSEPLLELISAPKFIGYLSQIMELVKLKAGDTCTRPYCVSPLTFTDKMYGTALVVQWGCTSGHSCGSWASQPKMKRMFCGNLQLSTSILFSGYSYVKIALLAKFLNLGIIGEPTFYQVQRLYAVPAINKYWTVMQTQLLSEKVRQRQDVCVAGDGRNDSPGHSAQFCTYSFSDLDTDAILHLEVVDVRQSTSSVAMEKVAFQHGLNFLTSKVKVTEVVTDQSPMITKVMRVLRSVKDKQSK